MGTSASTLNADSNPLNHRMTDDEVGSNGFDSNDEGEEEEMVISNNDVGDDNVQFHFDLKHHPHPKYESSHGVPFNDEGMSFVLLFLFIRVAKTIFSHFS